MTKSVATPLRTRETPMNHTEAMAVQKLLGYLLDPHDLDPAHGEEACEAAAYLADRSHTTLLTGTTGRQIEAGWDVIANGCTEGCETCARPLPGRSPS